MDAPAAERRLLPVPPWLLAVLSGLILGVSQPVVIEAFGDEPIDPTGWSGALAMVGFIPVLLAMRGATPRQAFGYGFLASFVQFTVNVQWLVVAMVVFGRIPLPASWLILSLLTAAIGAYVAAAYAITRLLVGRFSWPMWLVFPVVLCGTELLRNYGPLGGFPWGNVGTSFATVPLLLQPAALFGVYGLVFCAALVSSTAAEVLAAVLARRSVPRAAAITGALVVISWVGFGALRLAVDDTAGAPVVKVGLLQGNIEQGIRNHEVWNGRRILRRYHDLQDEAVRQGAQLVVWPEAAFPVRLRRDLESMKSERLVGDEVPQAAVVGAVGYERSLVDGKQKELRSNSAFIVGEGQQVVGRVDKTHLVPFGEYVPWPLSSIVRQIVPIGGTHPGSSYDAIPVKLGEHIVKLGTTICYEGIFPEISRQLRKAGAELHVNVTNDGWYGISGAATQHLNFYAIRAVESGMPVARAANTGKSGWADNRGRLHDKTPIYVGTAVVADIPLAVVDTLYVALGEWLALPCALATLFAWLWALVGSDVLRRPRPLLEKVLGVAGLLVAAGATVVYFGIPGAQLDEAYATRAQLVVVAGLLVGAGALSGRPWGRKAQLVIGLLAFAIGAAAGLLGAPLMLLVAVAGLALFVVQLRRPGAYKRLADPLVPVDR